MANKQLTVAICNFNTTKLTNDCIESVLATNSKYVKTINVLDNSDTTPFKTNFKDINCINNTTQKFISFDSILNMSKYPIMANNANNFGSFKHASSIQFLLNICKTKKMLLLDSDTLITSELDFLDSDCITAADIQQYGSYGYEDKKRQHIKYTSKTRFLPYIQLFDIQMMKDNTVSYFDFSRIHGILSPLNGNSYDTGASFYEDCVSKNLSFKRINYHNYIIHFGQGSWKTTFDHVYK